MKSIRVCKLLVCVFALILIATGNGGCSTEQERKTVDSAKKAVVSAEVGVAETAKVATLVTETIAKVQTGEVSPAVALNLLDPWLKPDDRVWLQEQVRKGVSGLAVLGDLATKLNATLSVASAKLAEARSRVEEAEAELAATETTNREWTDTLRTWMYILLGVGGLGGTGIAVRKVQTTAKAAGRVEGAEAVTESLAIGRATNSGLASSFSSLTDEQKRAMHKPLADAGVLNVVTMNRDGFPVRSA